MRMTFREFVLKFQARDTMRGDMVLDMQRDQRFTDTAKGEFSNWHQLRGYLLYNRGCNNSQLCVARRLWRIYEHACKKP